MMRISVDLRCLPANLPGAGIAHATRELWETLQKLAPRFDMEIDEWRSDSRPDAVLFPTGAVPLRMQISRAEVPMYPWVHDLAIFEHPEWFPQSRMRRGWTTRLFLRGLHLAKHLFAVSEDTKLAIMRRTGISEAKITVTRQGVSEKRVDERYKEFRLGGYALILGSVEPRKNIPFVVSLWPEVRRRAGNVRLIVAGTDGWGNVRWPKTEGVERLTGFDDEARDDLIRGARMALVPSLHEGFGRVALESMAAGVPVAASDRGALPEVVGREGILLEPDNREQWIAAVCRLFKDEDFAKRTAESGMRQRRRFSWETTARTILAKIAENC